MSRSGEPGFLPVFSGCTRGILCVVCVNSPFFNQPFMRYSVRHRLQTRCRAMRAPGSLAGRTGTATLWRTHMGQDIERHAISGVAQGKQLMEAAEREGTGTFVSARLDRSLFLPSRCASGAFQSSPIDPDTSTLPGTLFPEPGALHWRWPSVSIRSSLSSRCDEHNSISTSALREEGSTLSQIGRAHV